ncbi:MAG: nodulation protein NfeD [Immundisolibacter sp.]
MRYRPWPGLLALILLVIAGLAQADGVVRTQISGPIGPATASHMQQALDAAAAQQAQLLLVRLDTPGGLDGAMRDIIKAIIGAPLPVALYVAPSGARAASAGTYMLYAAHIAAMAPGTNLGAATPVQIGGGLPLPGRPGPGGGDGDADPGQDAQPSTPDAMQHKRVNDAVAYIRSLAELRGRNADWAEQAVREAASLSAQQALEQNVIDLLAASDADLLEQLNDRTVQLASGPVMLATAGAVVQDFEPDWRTRLLAVLTNPSVTYILLLIGIYGLFFEFASPGGVVPGVAGAIALLLALYGLQMLPVDYAGLGLILLGVGLMLAEVFAPSFGALGIGGTLALVIGSIILIDTEAPGFGIPLTLIGAVAASSLVLFTFVLGALWRARRGRVVSGGEALMQATATAAEDFTGEGHVWLHGERWAAHCAVPLRAGQSVRVRERRGLVVIVEPVEPDVS